MFVTTLAPNFKDVAQRLVNPYVNGHPVEIEPIIGGGNNRSYLIRCDDQRFFLKHYYRDAVDTRDRLAVDYSFSSYTWSQGIRSIPKPIVCDAEYSIGIYDYVQGRKLISSEIEPPFIQQSIEFVLRLNESRESLEAQKLPVASEACFSFDGHIQLIQKRISILETINVLDDIDVQAKIFIQKRLIPCWLELRQKISVDVEVNQKLSGLNKVLSPSDFGFHNALVNQRSELTFFDFEYAGWDDPAKLVCDFFLQPAIPVDMKYFKDFARKIAGLTECPELTCERIDILLPLLRVKWSCIALNCFVSAFKNRKNFSGLLTDKYRIMQLKKAENFLGSI